MIEHDLLDDVDLPLHHDRRESRPGRWSRVDRGGVLQAPAHSGDDDQLGIEWVIDPEEDPTQLDDTSTRGHDPLDEDHPKKFADLIEHVVRGDTSDEGASSLGLPQTSRSTHRWREIIT